MPPPPHARPVEPRTCVVGFVRPNRLRRATALRGIGRALGFPPQPAEKWRQERATRLLVLATARQLLRDISQHLGDTLARGELGDHLAVVRGRAEQTGVEW